MMSKDPLSILPYRTRMEIKYNDVNSYWDKQNIPYVTRVEAEKALELRQKKLSENLCLNLENQNLHHLILNQT